MAMFPTLRLNNLRRKVLLGFCIWLGAIGAIAAVSYYNLLRIEKKVMVVEMADDLSNTILEMRRFEKNYFLYGEGYKENVGLVGTAFAKLQELKETGPALHITDDINALSRVLSDYANRLEAIHAREARADTASVNQLRSLGQALQEMSAQLVRYERERIVQINNRLRKNLFLSLGLILLLAIGLIIFLNTRIIRPLRQIEDSTISIAEGTFEPVPLGRADDEILRIMQAINRMVLELDRRQEQLVQNKKLSSIGVLASGIAHQLNNPLNNISTSCQLLMEEETPDQEFQRKMLDNIDRETMRARDIVRGLLEFSRRKEFALRNERLLDVVNNALRLISSQVPPGVEIVSFIPEDIRLDVDRQQIQELLLNLLLNGIQALGDKGTGLAVYGEIDPFRDKAAICVEDDGCGISDEVRGQMFDPFFSTKDVGAGTGLGLYIAYGIVRKHRGEICVQGKEGVGTRFVINLPMHANNGGEERA